MNGNQQPSKRRKLTNECLEELEEDRISDLPNDLLHSILGLLPIESAAKTVVLSRRWRTVFSSLPDLDFTVGLPNSVLGHPDFLGVIPSPRNEVIIEHVLSHRDHNSCIRTLKLTSSLSSTVLNFIMECARTYNVQELDVKVSCIQFRYVNFPWHMLVNCGSLKILRLNSMCLNFNPTRSLGFESLHTIALSYIIADSSLHKFTDSMFPSLTRLMLHSCNTEKLDINCSGLKDLVIRKCYRLQLLNVYGFKLERLKVDSCFTNHVTNTEIKIVAPLIKSLEWVGNYIMHIPVLEKSSSMERANIGLLLGRNMITPEQKSCFSKMMIALSHVKALKFQYPFTEILRGHYFRGSFLNKFQSLTQLAISTSINFQGFATLFKNCPYLHTLVITTYDAYVSRNREPRPESGGDKYWQDQIPELISFLNHLKVVKITWFYGNNEELFHLAKFLLHHGKVLENMIFYIMNPYRLTVTPSVPSKRIKSIMDLFWLSSKVKVFF